MQTGTKVEFTQDNYGTTSTIKGTVLYVINDSAYVLWSSYSKMVKMSDLRVMPGSAPPMRGNGLDALRFVTRNIPETNDVHQVCAALLFQATGGNCKLGNAALDIITNGSTAKVWKLVRGIVGKVESASQWGDVRRAADELA